MKEQGYLSNPRSQDKLRAREKLRVQRDDEDLRSVLAAPQGRRFFWRIMSHMTNTFGLSFDRDAGAMAFNDGRRSVGVDLMAEAQRVAPEVFVQTIQEQWAAQREDDLHRKAAENTEE